MALADGISVVPTRSCVRPTFDGPRPAVSTILRLSETSGFTLGLEEAEDVVLANYQTHTSCQHSWTLYSLALGCHDRLSG